MIKSFATYIFQSLQVATLTLVASLLRDKQRETAARTLSSALMLAAGLGLLTTICLSVSSSRFSLLHHLHLHMALGWQLA